MDVHVHNAAVPVAYVDAAEDRRVNRNVALLKSALVVGAFVATAAIFSWEVALIGGSVALICWLATLGNRNRVFYQNYIAPVYGWPGRFAANYIPRRNYVDNVGVYVPGAAPALRPPVNNVPAYAYPAPAPALRQPVNQVPAGRDYGAVNIGHGGSRREPAGSGNRDPRRR